ncbi:MAG: hypothetical protein E6H76_10675 [Betaproteobacteria bacterium]|nr:MAG: hypothetical protein E6H76_10675 [Betaproteobacteria bacterium]
MKIRVQCYAGHRGEEEPRAFDLGERHLEVIEIIDRWLAPDHRYFKVCAGDGNVYILRHDELAGEWEMTSFTERP